MATNAAIVIVKELMFPDFASWFWILLSFYLGTFSAFAIAEKMPTIFEKEYWDDLWRMM